MHIKNIENTTNLVWHVWRRKQKIWTEKYIYVKQVMNTYLFVKIIG